MVKIVTYVLAMSSLLSSCDLFGGRGDDPKGGEVVWRLENQRENLVGTQPLIKDGKVYFIQDGYLKAYTLDKGNRVWQTQIVSEGNGGYNHRLVESGDKVFLDQGFDIQAHSKSDGSIVWETQVTDDAEEVSGIGEPIMSQDEDHLYAGRKGYVLQLRKRDGQIVRRYPLDRMVPEGVLQGSTEPIISPFGDGMLYVPTSYWDPSGSYPEEASGGNVFAFDASTGDLIWERQIIVTTANPYPDVPGDSLTSSPNMYDAEVQGDLLIVLAGSAVVALDRLTGEKVWESVFSDDGFDVGLATNEHGVYIASAGWHATGLDLETGEEIWRRDITFSNTSIPTVQDGRFYFNNSGGGGIWVLDTATGSVIYHKNTPNHDRDSYDVYISSLGVGEGYMVNVGSKAVYCLRVP
ncbi:MAG TPA: PQQ-binding-like beta-propeller repeat protein [Fodinibius sp.]|nr:PQQ-binding-like beta-propeller repeat protein [Fodinibius sp.]